MSSKPFEVLIDPSIAETTGPQVIELLDKYMEENGRNKVFSCTLNFPPMLPDTLGQFVTEVVTLVRPMLLKASGPAYTDFIALSGPECSKVIVGVAWKLKYRNALRKEIQNKLK